MEDVERQIHWEIWIKTSTCSVHVRMCRNIKRGEKKKQKSEAEDETGKEGDFRATESLEGTAVKGRLVQKT